MPLLEPIDRPFDELQYIGVAIKRVQHTHHTGLLYKVGDQTRMVHLAFHHILRDELPDLTYRWVSIQMDEMNAEIVANFAARVARAENPIPYAFDATGVCFDPATGELLEPPAGKGLTCATFILAILHAWGHSLIDEPTWPERDDDVAFREYILSLYAEQAVPDEFVSAVTSQPNVARIKPSEVCGAATVHHSDWPVTFENAVELAQRITADLAAA